MKTSTEEIKKRLDLLREAMKEGGIDAVILPQNDPHISEYISSHWQIRRYFSGFTGSAGTLVVTAGKAALWTDSRYFIQAAQQLEGTGIELMKELMPGVPDMAQWLCDKLEKGMTVGFDGLTMSVTEAEALEEKLKAEGIAIAPYFKITEKLWPGRPGRPSSKLFIHEEKYAGESAESKLGKVIAAIKERGADSIFISALDEIAWLLNIRANDVKYNPVAASFLYVSAQDKVLMVEAGKVDASVKKYLEAQGVRMLGYDDYAEFLSALPEGEKVLVEPSHTAYGIFALLGERALRGTSPLAMLKACKNETQLKGIRNAMLRDGVALVKAMIEIEERMEKRERTTEMDISEILRKYRSAQPLYFSESFGTIAGYGPHGAIVHYEAKADTDAVLEPHGLLLIDSGAQYLDGTTDITRTIALGSATEREKHDFTLVMKGHIALDSAVFPEGTRGTQLDVLARQYLWKEGMTYMHGTGHGVGQFLNVHEGPQGIRNNYLPAPLMPGMVTSNEPGLYVEGVHGIRCENLILCKERETTPFGKFMCFETLTLFPFDRGLFDLKMMSVEEIAWVDNYHRKVFETLSPMLEANENEWLAEKTRPLRDN